MTTALARNAQQLGQAVRNRRRGLKLTQAELAEKVGSYQKTISQLEAGHGGVKLETVFNILAALNLEIVVQPRSAGATRVEDIF